MRTRIVKIGNSQGVRIPKSLLEESGLTGDVDITAEPGSLTVTAAGPARAGWEEAARRMHEAGDDELIDGEWPPTSVELEDWEWE